MKRFSWALIAVVLLFGLVSGCSLFTSDADKNINKTTTVNNSPSNTNQTVPQGKVTVKINADANEIKEYSVNFKSGMTALEALQTASQENNFTLETKKYSFGYSVEKIGDKQNGTDKAYWLYDYNGQPAMVGVDQQALKAGDELVFKYQAQ